MSAESTWFVILGRLIQSLMELLRIQWTKRKFKSDHTDQASLTWRAQRLSSFTCERDTATKKSSLLLCASKRPKMTTREFKKLLTWLPQLISSLLMLELLWITSFVTKCLLVGETAKTSPAPWRCPLWRKLSSSATNSAQQSLTRTLRITLARLSWNVSETPPKRSRKECLTHRFARSREGMLTQIRRSQDQSGNCGTKKRELYWNSMKRMETVPLLTTRASSRWTIRLALEWTLC